MPPEKPIPGSICWRDLTVANADVVRDFYSAVVGWRAEAVDMGGYSDFNMIPPGGGEAAAGICRARGSNADLPAQWLIYIVVENIERSAKLCLALGGKVIAGPRSMGTNRFCVIQDPVGAVAALIEP